MSPMEIRAMLIRQHASLRDLSHEVLGEAIAAIDARTEPPAALRRAIEVLAEALRQHNLEEEVLLADVLPTVDAWGKIRCAAMDEAHRSEHCAIEATLVAILHHDSAVESAELLRAFVGELLAHMEAEERMFLAAHVLRDDICALEGFAD